MGYSNTLPVTYLPTLVVHTHPAAAAQLAGRLRRAGYPADTVIDCREARAAMRARDYAAVIFVGALSNPAQRRRITALRRPAPRTWLIAISPAPLTEAEEVSLRPEIDAFVCMPFSIQELTSRLSAFSMRSRPP